MSNNLEVDFLAVGNGEKSGDAIAIRWGDFSDASKQYVAVIDGGTTESGEALVKLIKETYKTTFVGLVICTHPDGDHSSGLRVVLKELGVGKLWMHRPWDRSDEILHMFKDDRITNDSLEERLKEAYNFAHELQKIAEEKKIPIEEPFAGKTIAGGGAKITILGPSEEAYVSLIPNFAKSPEVKSATETFSAGLKEAVNWVKEALHIETLDESGETTAENNSSIVALLEFDGERILLTGDAGIPAMKNAIHHADQQGISLENISLFQVPHHGSKRNISPSILNRIKAKTAFISAAKEAEKHPAKKVVNACIRRNMKVYSTKGQSLRQPYKAPERAGYSAAQELSFSEMVEE